MKLLSLEPDGSDTLVTLVTLSERIFLHTAQQFVLSLVRSRGITDELKATNRFRWAQEMNKTITTVEEMIFKEFIYA